MPTRALSAWATSLAPPTQTIVSHERDFAHPTSSIGRLTRQSRSINLLSRVLHVLERGDDLAGDLAVLLDHLTDMDVLDRIVGDRVHAEGPARGVELDFGHRLRELVLVRG